MGWIRDDVQFGNRVIWLGFGQDGPQVSDTHPEMAERLLLARVEEKRRDLVGGVILAMQYDYARREWQVLYSHPSLPRVPMGQVIERQALVPVKKHSKYKVMDAVEDDPVIGEIIDRTILEVCSPPMDEVKPQFTTALGRKITIGLRKWMVQEQRRRKLCRGAHLGKIVVQEDVCRLLQEAVEDFDKEVLGCENPLPGKLQFRHIDVVVDPAGLSLETLVGLADDEVKPDAEVRVK